MHPLECFYYSECLVFEKIIWFEVLKKKINRIEYSKIILRKNPSTQNYIFFHYLFYIQIIEIFPIFLGKVDALVSLQTSLKIYMATYKMPVTFESFELTGLPWIVMSPPQLVKLLTSHYLTSLLFRAGWLVGSLDLIGSPTAFVQQVSNGVYDFLQMPYHGLKYKGATGLFEGLSNGSISLIRNLSAGSITSLTSFSSFVSRNMDILSCDPHHLARQEQLRHQSPENFGMNSNFYSWHSDSKDLFKWVILYLDFMMSFIYLRN